MSIKPSKRYLAARRVQTNWRIRKRLPRITELAVKLGFIRQSGYLNYADYASAQRAYEFYPQDMESWNTFNQSKEDRRN